MKKNWKCWLGTVAAAMLGGSVMAQAPQYPAAGPDFGFDGEGSIRMGTESGSAVATPAQYPGYQPVDADAIWQEAPRAYQGAPPPQDDSVGFASATSFADVQYRVGRVNNDQYGFQGGYTTLNAFIPIATDGMNMWFFDPRLNITDFGEGAASLGLGYRRYSPSMDRIFGISGWYDYDPGHRGEYSQAGLSLENIGRYFSTRFNANVPFEDSNQYTTANSFGTPFFQGNNIAYLFNFLREITYQQYQLEAAAPIPFLGRYGGEWALSAYGLVGGDNASKDALGIAGRFEFQVSEDFWINTIVSHDRIFGTNTSINFELTIPSGVQTRWLRPKKVQDKLLASVKRPYRVSTNTVSLQETQFFLDQRDGNPIVVAHIDPTAANGAASGSVTNPFGSVADYMADPNRADFDIIFVGRNAAANDDTDLNTGIELLTGQRLLGTGDLLDSSGAPLGSVHEFHFIDRGDGITTLDLPGFANGTAQSTGPNPFLTNSGAAPGTPVVTINGNITEVSGFTIDASGNADGIATPFATAVDGFVITSNTFQNAIDAVDITSNTSAALGFDTTLPPSRFGGENFGIVTNNIVNGTALQPVQNGIVINHIAGAGAEDLNLLIGQNSITGVTDIGINVIAIGGTVDGNDSAFGLQNNTIDSSGQGILAIASGVGTVFDLAVQGNEITNSTNVVDAVNPERGAGMGFLATAGAQMNFNVISDNVVTNSGIAGGRGAAFVTENAGVMTFAPIVAGQSVFFQNTFSNNASDGLLFSATGAGSGIILNDLSLNLLTNNGGSGLVLAAAGGGQIGLGTMVGNTITGNAEDGISGTATGAGSLLDLTIGSAVAQNQISNNTQNGIDLLATLDGTVQGAIVNNAISDNTINGILISATEPTSFANFNDAANGRQISDNVISGNTVSGVTILADNTGGPVAGTGAAALFLRNEISSTAGNTQQFGIRGLGLRTGNLDLNIGDTDPLNANLITGHIDANIDVDLAGASTADVVIQNNLITNAVNGPSIDFAGDGVVFRTTDTSQLFNAEVRNNVITGNEGDGVRVEANGTSRIHAAGGPATPGLIVTSNVITNNGQDGIGITRNGASIVTGVIGATGGATGTSTLGNTIQGNGRIDPLGNGINIVTSGGTAAGSDAVNIVAGQNNISGNENNGVNIVTNDASNTRVDLISNILNGTATGFTQTQNSGISLTTNNLSYFGTVGGADSLWDGNVITNHTANGIQITRNNVAEAHVDIYGNVQQSVIANNALNGVQINDQSLELVAFTTATMDITIGDPASILNAQGPNTPPNRPNVVIAQNLVDAIQINQTGTELLVVNVNNTLALGGQATGTASRDGLSFNGNDTFRSNGADTFIIVDNSTFTGFGRDGMHVFYDDTAIFGNPALSTFNSTLNMLVTDSIIGQNEFSFNQGDGVDIEVRENGANFVFDNNIIQNNRGDGFRLSLHAETLVADRPTVTLDRDSDIPTNAQNDTVTPGNPGLNARADYDYTNSVGPGAPFGDTNFIDVTTGVNLTRNVVRFNGEDGIEFAMGAATSLGTQNVFNQSALFGNDTSGLTLDARLLSYEDAIVRASDMSGNGRFGFYTRTQDAIVGATTNTSGTPNLTNQTQLIQLDPLAHLWLAFGDGGGANANIGTNLNPMAVGDPLNPAIGVYANDPNKSATTNRPILTNFHVNTNNNSVFTFAGGTPDPLGTLGRFQFQYDPSTFGSLGRSLQDRVGGGNQPTYFYSINSNGAINNVP